MRVHAYNLLAIYFFIFLTARNSLEICNSTSILRGNWSFHKQLAAEYNPWRQCLNISSVPRPSQGFDHYACLDRSKYLHAHYQPLDCHLMHINDLVGYFTGAAPMPLYFSLKPNSRITIVGDSLSEQIYTAMSCIGLDTEHHLSLIHEVFLRSDIPCFPQCLVNNSYLKLANEEDLLNCWACRTGKAPSKRFVDVFSWLHNITADTGYLVIGGGAWYNGAKSILNSTKAFTQTLYDIGPALHQFIVLRNIAVYWVGLPPVTNSSDEQLWGYDWRLFREKDTLAREILKAYGVRFINTDALTRQRKTADVATTADGLHWCNPGHNSVPTFLARVLLQSMLADSKL